jgi:hypothetical protein
VTLAKASVDDTSSGDSADHFKAGLQQNKCSVTLRNQFDASKVYATLQPLWANETTFDVKIVPASGACTSTNPGFVFDCILLELPVLNGKPGDLQEAKIEFTVNSVVSIDTT